MATLFEQSLISTSKRPGFLSGYKTGDAAQIVKKPCLGRSGPWCPISGTGAMPQVEAKGILMSISENSVFKPRSCSIEQRLIRFSRTDDSFRRFAPINSDIAHCFDVIVIVSAARAQLFADVGIPPFARQALDRGQKLDWNCTKCGVITGLAVEGAAGGMPSSQLVANRASRPTATRRWSRVRPP